MLIISIFIEPLLIKENYEQKTKKSATETHKEVAENESET